MFLRDITRAIIGLFNLNCRIEVDRDGVTGGCHVTLSDDDGTLFSGPVLWHETPAFVDKWTSILAADGDQADDDDGEASISRDEALDPLAAFNAYRSEATELGVEWRGLSLPELKAAVEAARVASSSASR